MTNILAKGSKTGVQDEYFDWNEEENLKLYNVAFYDLPDLLPRRNEFMHPWYSREDAVCLPTREDVIQFLDGGNDLVVRLPPEQVIRLRGMDRDGNQKDNDGNPIRYECDLLEWLPFYVVLNGEEEGNNLVEVVDDFDDWDSCFSKSFEWATIIEEVGQRGLYGNGEAYKDPRPENPAPDEPIIRSRAAPQRYGPKINEEQIAVDNVKRTIASKISLVGKDDQENVVVTEGSVYLIPEQPDKEFDEFVQDILIEVFEEDIDPIPEWVSNYKLPGEERLRSELESLENQLTELEQRVEKAEWYQQLLFANDNLEHFELEEPVRDAFREIGLQVDGEVDGKRDGGIQLEDKTIILEVTGRRRGVKPGKIDKLAKHVAHANQKGYCDNCTGLLVYNARRKTDPNSRSLNADNFIGDLEDTGYKFMTSLQVYLMVSMHSKGEIEKSDVVEKLTGDDNIVEFGEFSGMNSEEDFNSRISSIRKRLDRLL
jgi:hypothetical protein